jgi:hypothetical protein
MEKASHPSLDDNSDHSDIGSDIFSHDESDLVRAAYIHIFTRTKMNLKIAIA